MFERLNVSKAIKAGFWGTVVMTIMMYGLPPLMGLPPMDIMAALGSVFPFKISPYVPGSLAHVGFGIVLGLIYAAFFFGWLPGPRRLKGAIFSFLPWIFAITFTRAVAPDSFSNFLNCLTRGRKSLCGVEPMCSQSDKPMRTG
jgi:hypothetical protein